ncbi:alpha/beta hydrolase-fold protein [Flexibacter flexilis]|nr:alpha/beta hydrolase-fold protein [Flexibacter flexilis]
MKNIFLLLLGLCIVCQPVLAQKNKATQAKRKPLTRFTKTMMALNRVANLPNAAQRKDAVADFWEEMVSEGNVPYISGDSVAFLYKGEADSVFFHGDFDGWSARPEGFQSRARRVGKTDIWLLKASFPSAARLDYKIVVNDRWILDPANPFQQWGGAGPNSELRMPAWHIEPATVPNYDIVRGNLSENIRIKSRKLGYDVQYQVYTPADYEDLRNLPTIYLTDGQEYSSSQMGSMITVLDNLIANKEIKPVIAVFIDPRNPDTLSQNRREKELLLNDKFVDFVVTELVPEVDYNFKTSRKAADRAMMGLSWGGLSTAYFGYKASHTFSMLGLQSPEFGDKPEIYTFYEQSPKLPISRIFMSTGTIRDTEKSARRMKEIMEKKGYIVQYREVPEGHSWGNWRALIDEPLIYFFAR